MARRHFLAFSTLAATLVMSAGSLAAPMPEAEFRALVEQYDEKFAEARASGSLKLEDAVAIQTQFVDKFPVRDLTLAQLRELSQRRLITTYTPGSEHDRTKEALAALEPMTYGGSVEAVDALALKAQLLDSNNPDHADETIETIKRLLTHRRFHEALRENRANSIWYAIGYGVDKDRMPDIAEALAIAAARFPGDAPVGSLAGMTTVYEKAMASGDAAARNAADALRVKTIALLKKAAESDDEQAQAMARREISSLEAAPKIAQLVGNPAPELNFTWSSSGESLKTLADLRGKVVVLDFWATWCGPCISSFPQVREMVDHYKGYAVEVIGVTSPQKATYFKSGRETAETPEEEYEQMERFIAERDINWTVAFTEQEVFNPEYGVRGIPHVVIIDPDGKIVHRALHPAGSLAKKAALIDPILEEFGLEHPPTPTEEVADAQD